MAKFPEIVAVSLRACIVIRLGFVEMPVLSTLLTEATIHSVLATWAVKFD